MANGILIVIEGLDGSGKATQTALLSERLVQNGRQVLPISFPDYNSRSSALVQMYLQGEIGTLQEVNSFAASSFYSLDRYISYQTVWKDAYAQGTIILADRYSTSNVSHQMAKLSPDRWEEYIHWLTDFEYNLLELPPPTLVLYLDMHPMASKKLLSARYNGDESKKDLHEKNFAYMLQCREAALFAAKRLGWRVIKCSDQNHLPLPIEEVSKMIDAFISYLLTEELT